MAQEVFTQWIFLLPPISFGEFIVLAETPQQRRIRGISNQPGRDRKAAPFHYGQVFSAWGRNSVLSPYSITNTQNFLKKKQQLRMVLADSNKFRTHTPLAQQWEIYLVQEGSKPTQVICRVWSLGRANTGWPHGVRELKALTRSRCSVARVCFNHESKSSSDKRFTAPGEELIGKWVKARRSISKRNRILFLLLPKFCHLCTAQLLWCFWNTG